MGVSSLLDSAARALWLGSAGLLLQGRIPLAAPDAHSLRCAPVLCLVLAGLDPSQATLAVRGTGPGHLP